MNLVCLFVFWLYQAVLTTHTWLCTHWSLLAVLGESYGMPEIESNLVVDSLALILLYLQKRALALRLGFGDLILSDICGSLALWVCLAISSRLLGTPQPPTGWLHGFGGSLQCGQAPSEHTCCPVSVCLPNFFSESLQSVM